MSFHDRQYHQIFLKDNRNNRISRGSDASKRNNKLQTFERDIKKMMREQVKAKGQISDTLYPAQQYLIVKGPKIDKLNIRKPNSDIKILKRKKQEIKQQLRDDRVRKFNKKISKG